MPDGVFIVYTDVDADHEDEFNKWYDEIHIPDLLELGCVTGAQRYRLTGDGQEVRLKTGELHTPRFLTIYHLNTSDEKLIRNAIDQARPTWTRKGRMFSGFRSGQNTVYEVLGQADKAIK